VPTCNHILKPGHLIVRLENIKINQCVETWEEAIQNVGDAMIASRSVTQEYVDEMINAVKIMGPYIVIAKHVAIAHSAPSKSVLRNDTALSVLKTPINFNSANDPVYLMFGFCSVDSSSHLDNLVALANVLGEDEEVTDQLILCKSEQEIYEIFNRDI